MISYLEGKIVFKTDKYIILDVQGVGYKVFLSPAAIGHIGAPGEHGELFTHLHLRENKGLELYGFLRAKELALFDLLIEVQGIGPRSALAMLGEALVEDLERAIASGDEQFLTRMAGVGKKKATKIVLELKEKYEGLALVLGEEKDLSADAVDALKKLGYSEREAREAFRRIPRDASRVEEKIKEALKILGTK